MQRFRRGGMNFVFAIKTFLGENKVFCIVLCALAVIGLFMGAFVAARWPCGVDNLGSFSLAAVGVQKTFIFQNVWSVFLQLTVISVSSLWVGLVPIGCAMIAIQAYGIGKGCIGCIGLLGVALGFGAMIVGVAIMCAVLVFEISFFVKAVGISVQKKRFGRSDEKLWKWLVVALGASFVVMGIYEVVVRVVNITVIFVV